MTTLNNPPSPLILLILITCRVLQSHAKVFHLPAVQRFLHNDPASKFGYSVTSFIAHERAQFFVGAPEDIDFMTDEKLGQVYRLNINVGESTQCWSVPVATDDEERKRFGHRTPALTRSLGATIASATKAPDGIGLACDPLHTYFSKALDDSVTQSTIGQCALYTGSSMRYSVVDPCPSQDEGSCLAGFSASVMPGPNSNQTSVVLGMPGSFLVEGNVFLGTYEGKKMTNSVLLKATPEDLKHKGFSLGYAVSMGNLLPQLKDKRRINIIASSPVWKDNENRGVILISNREMNLDQILYINDTNGHVGSFFGYCLEIGDFNGDGIGDIVVGAPYYSNVTMGKIKANIGQVYIFFGGMTTVRGEPKYVANTGQALVLQGTDDNGRFGHSLANIGDIDSDGVDDLAVGCPFCGPMKTGAVYIFSGSKSGDIDTNPLQIIYATDISIKPIAPVCPQTESTKISRPYKAFGWSLSGKYDMDGNEVPDLMVGDYQSGQITLLRSRVSVWLSTPTWKIQQNATIPWTSTKNEECNRECRFNFTLEATVNGLATFLMKEVNVILFDVYIDLDSLVENESYKRLTFTGFTKSVMKKLEAFRMSSYISGITDRRRIFKIFSGSVEPKYDNTKLNIWRPIVINVTVVPREEYASSDSKLPWLLHPRRSLRTFLSKKMLFQNRECGVDNVCIADLYIQMYDRSYTMYDRELDTIYFRERESNRNLTIYIGNKGENAYSPKLKLTIPYTLKVVPPPIMTCVQSDSSDSSVLYTMICSLKDPFPTLKLNELPVAYQFQIDTAQAFMGLIENKTTDVLTISAEVVSGNKDSFLEDNTASINYKLVAKSSVSMTSSSEDPTIIDRRNFSLSISKLQKVHTKSIGPYFKHIFLVTNTGTSPAERVYIKIDIPVLTEDGFYLVYLLDDVRRLSNTSRPLTIRKTPEVVSKDGEVRGSCHLPMEYIDPLLLDAVDIEKSKQRYKRSTIREKFREPNISINRKPRSSVMPTVRTSQQEKVSCKDKSSVFGRIKCVTVTCQINNLTHNDAVRINVHGWLWADTFFRYRVSDVIVLTNARGWVDAMTLGVPLSGDRNISEVTIARNIVFEGIKILVMKQIPIWPLILGIFLGLITLAFIIIAMWRCGFFQRNRVQSKGDDEVYM